MTAVVNGEYMSLIITVILVVFIASIIMYVAPILMVLAPLVFVVWAAMKLFSMSVAIVVGVVFIIWMFSKL